jgi:hypothetical protein
MMLLFSLLVWAGFFYGLFSFFRKRSRKKEGLSFSYDDVYDYDNDSHAGTTNQQDAQDYHVPIQLKTPTKSGDGNPWA